MDSQKPRMARRCLGSFGKIFSLLLAAFLPGLACSPEPKRDRPAPESIRKAEKSALVELSGELQPPPSDVASAAPEDQLAAHEIFDLMKKKCEGIESYACKLETYARAGDQEEQSLSEFFFKRPGQVLLQMIEGDNPGAKVARDREGVNRARPGGALSLVKIEVAPDDPRLQSVRGIPFYMGDWETILGELEAWLAVGWTLARLPDEPMAGADCYVVEMTAPDGADPSFRQRIWIDRERHLMIRRSQYENEILVDHDVYHDIRLNVELDDRLFELRIN